MHIHIRLAPSPPRGGRLRLKAALAVTAASLIVIIALLSWGGMPATFEQTRPLQHGEQTQAAPPPQVTELAVPPPQSREQIGRDSVELAAAQLAGGAHEASLHIEFLAPDGRGLEGRAELRRKGDPQETPVYVKNMSVDSVTHIDLEDIGAFILRIANYPPGYMPPDEANGQIFVDDNNSNCEFDVEIVPGPNYMTIRMAASAFVEGYVYDERGNGAPNVLVCAHHQGVSRPKDYYCTTALNGYYRVTCPPGSARVRLHFERDHPLFAMARPIPRNVVLVANAKERIDFTLSADGGRVSGTIIDQDGNAVSKLRVLCCYRPDEEHLPVNQRAVYTLRDYILATESEQGGRFELTGLPRGRFAIRIGPEDYKPVGDGRLGMLGPTRIVELGATDVIDLGIIHVTTSRPFRVDGHVVLKGRWAGRESAIGQLQLVAVLPVGVRRKKITEERIALRMVGNKVIFKWACETPEEGVLLEIRGPNNELVQEPVWPIPNTEAQVVMQFPN